MEKAWSLDQISKQNRKDYTEWWACLPILLHIEAPPPCPKVVCPKARRPKASELEGTG